jgi:pimeloyl-ACP methyl ester carboxylesterase
VEPIVITDQGHFFTGLRRHHGPAGTSVYGTHVQYQTPRSVRASLVLVHGGGGQGLDMLGPADGRPGWATCFLRAGFAVSTVDRPGLGRSPYHPDIYGAYGPPASYEGFVASFAGPAPEGGPPHTQWPGDGGRDDPALATFLAGQEPFPGDIAAAHNDMLAGAVGLLERIGPSVLLTHSFGGGFGWLARSECPSLVRAVVAVEPAGPPFVTLGHGAADAATAGYLRSCRGRRRRAAPGRARPARQRPRDDAREKQRRDRRPHHRLDRQAPLASRAGPEKRTKKRSEKRRISHI